MMNKFQAYYEQSEIENKRAFSLATCREERRVTHSHNIFWYYGVKMVLDVGCGYGYYSRWFHEAGFDVTACDFSEKNLAYAKEHNPGAQYRLIDFENESITEEHDAAYCFDVIEHVYDYDKFVKNIWTSLKKDGILIISTPNVLAPSRRIRVLFGRETGLVSKAHIHFFSPANLKSVLESNGFRCVILYGSGKLSFMGPGMSGNIWAVGIK